MALINEVKDRLEIYGIEFRENGNSVEIDPKEGGFLVGITDAPGNHVVYFDGWHEHFGSSEEALKCFGFGLSSAARLRVELREKTPTKWALQSKGNGTWATDSEVGLLLSPFWRKRQIEYRQNFWLTPEANDA